MDLGAYAQIEDIGKYLHENNIHLDIPRLRGYRLMSQEQKVEYNDATGLHFVLEDMLTSYPRWACDGCHVYSWRTRAAKKKYLVYDGDEAVDIKWELVHGKNRKRAKLLIKQHRRAVKKQLDTFNKYVGNDNILYVHARIGGKNWDYFDAYKTVARQPWFIEKVDDFFDDTYCDIYVDLAKAKAANKSEVL